MCVYNCVKIPKDTAPIALKSKRNLFSQIVADTPTIFPEASPFLDPNGHPSSCLEVLSDHYC